MTHCLEKISQNLQQTEDFANEFLSSISQISQNHKAIVVGLVGDLGSGKTTFTKYIGKALGVTETIQSPTFVLQKTYSIKNQTLQARFKTLYHLDLYRIDNKTELDMLRLDEVFANPENLVFIEWPEKAQGALPNDMITVTFRFIDNKCIALSYDHF